MSLGFNTARWMRAGKGFTLIEILIVIVLMSIISSVALITLSTNSKKQIETFAHQIARTLTLAEQEAMLRSVTLGVAFSQGSFQFFQYRPSDKKDETSWKALTDKNLGFHKIPDNIRLHINVNQQPVPFDSKPYLIISESGDITPFTIALANRSDKPDYLIKGEASGNIDVEEYHER